MTGHSNSERYWCGLWFVAWTLVEPKLSRTMIKNNPAMTILLLYRLEGCNLRNIWLLFLASRDFFVILVVLFWFVIYNLKRNYFRLYFRLLFNFKKPIRYSCIFSRFTHFINSIIQISISSLLSNNYSNFI